MAYVYVSETGTPFGAGDLSNTFASVQAAINAASNGDMILVAPGTYHETNTTYPGSPLGLVIDKSVTIQGVDASGVFITDASQVAAHIVSGAQSNWGTNFFVTADGVTLAGLDFVGADGSAPYFQSPGVVNKAIEVVGDNFTLVHSRVGAADGIDVSTTVYINDSDGADAQANGSHITHYLLDQNVLEGTVFVGNGPGIGHAPGELSFVISNNDFVYNPGSTVGYNWGLEVAGRDPSVAWFPASVVAPQISGNSFTPDYSVLLLTREADLSRAPDRTYVESFIAQNDVPVYSYAVNPDGTLDTDPTDANIFVVYGDPISAVGDAEAGDTIILKSAAAPSSLTVDGDDLTFNVVAGSGHVTFTLGDGVHDITLAGSQSVDVHGNTLANQIVGNAGGNVILADAGDDTIDGGTGNDTYDASAAGSGGTYVDLDTGGGSGISFSSSLGIDHLTGIENLAGSAGNDVFFGNAGSNVFFASAGNDQIDGRGGVDTFDASAATTAVSVNLSSGAVTGAFTATLTGVENVVTGGGADSITLSSASNAVDGGAGVDTVFAGSAPADFKADVVANGDGSWSLTAAAGGTDTLKNVEVINTGDGHHILLVGSGGYASIQAAINAAVAGDTIRIASGSYHENLTIGTSSLTIIADAGATLQGSFATDNHILDGVSVSDWLKTAPGYNGAAGTAISLTGSHVSISGLAVKDYNYGVDLKDGANNDTLTDMDFSGNIVGVRKGTTATIDTFTLKGGSISDGYIGLDFDKNTSVANAALYDASHVLIDGTGFSDLLRKGIYVETLTESRITNVTMDNVGQWGGVPSSGPNGQGGNGIDLNLKNGVYANIEIDHFHLTDTGASNEDGAVASDKNGGAIVVEARNDGTTYGPAPATLSGVTIHDGTIDGATSVAIQLGEPGKANVASVTVTGVDISGAQHTAQFGEVVNESDTGLFTITGTDSADHYVASGNSDGAFEMHGGGGADTLTGGSHADHLLGGGGADVLAGGGGADSLDGGDGDDTYLIHSPGVTVVEGSGADSGTDTVHATVDVTLAANVESLVLDDFASDTQDFDDMATGAIADGENGWKVVADGRDQGIADLSGNHVFKMSSDPSVPDFAGPYSPDLGVAAGEPGTGAAGDVQVLSFRIKPVQAVADNSRLEVDIGNSQGNDRNNFLVFESIAEQGLRIAVSESNLSGVFSSDAGYDDNSDAFTGNRTLLSHLDTSVWHDVELHVRYNAGANNDVIDVYVDGVLAGETTTFENYHDSITGPGGHDSNAAAYQTDRIFFRPSAHGAPADGDGGQNQGFYFDDITNTVTKDISGTGNALANTITGNSGDNALSGLDGDDTIHGGDGNDSILGGNNGDTLYGDAGNDTIDGGAGNDVIDGGAGNDVIIAGTVDADQIDGGAGSDSVWMSGAASADDTVAVTFNGTSITALNSTTITNVEKIDLGLGTQGTQGDTLSYATSSAAISVSLAAGTASGFHSISDVENVVGGSGGDTITGDGNDNRIAGGSGNDTLSGGGGTDTVVLAHNVNDYSISYNSGTYTLIFGTEVDTITGFEKFAFADQTVDVTVNSVINASVPVFSSGASASFDEGTAGALASTAQATDADNATTFGNIVYSLEGADATLFNINGSTGAVTIIDAADYETRDHYNLTVVATQGITSSSKSVIFNVNDLNDTNPVFSSGATGSVDENAAISTVVYDASATDVDTHFGGVTFSLGSGHDEALFAINAGTGEVTLLSSADFESTHSFTIVVNANQGVTSTPQTVTISVNNLNDNAPVFSNPQTTVSVAENLPAAATVVFDANADDADNLGAILYSLSGDDASLFNINSSTGEVRLKTSANFEDISVYHFNVDATQGTGAFATSSEAVTLNITDVDEHISGLGTITAHVEAGSTNTPLGPFSSDTSLTFDVTSLDAGTGGHILLNGTDLSPTAAGLTLAQVNSLTFSSGTGDGGATFLVRQGSNTEVQTLVLDVTAGVSKTYNGHSYGERIDGANGDDKVNGLGGSDTLLGGAGKDALDGGTGADQLTGGAGNDQFVFNTKLSQTGIDTITDFSRGHDKLVVQNAYFAVGSKVDASEVWHNTTGKAHDGNDRFILETDTGKLFYDKDGTGHAAAVQIAVLETSPGHHPSTLTAGDFLVI